MDKAFTTNAYLPEVLLQDDAPEGYNQIPWMKF